ncbi:MAG: PBP1A family penicillin-binding protein [Candidatus Eisenbacteria bacterium]|nr:PBP1A family penicillin-binding protein [Candidatus Eisenbacteria bacterium]
MADQQTLGFVRRNRVPILVAGLFLLAGIFLSAFRWASAGLPSPAKLQTIEPPVKTELYDINGELVYEFYKENRSLVPLAKIPRYLVEGTIAIEDRQFRKHWGVDIQGIGRAAAKNILRGNVTAEGASTITMQLARNLFLTYEKTFSRKIKEAILAFRIERAYSKDEILEMYFNQIYFGEGAYGAQAASKMFFAKNVDELSIAEAAVLTGVLRNHREYSPRRHPDTALRRRNFVLRVMLNDEIINKEEYEAAVAAPLGVTPSRMSPRDAPYFAETVRLYLDERYGSNQVYEGGLRVYSTLDLRLQRAAEMALEKQMCHLEETMKYKVRRCYQPNWEGGAGDNHFMPYVQGAVLAIDPSNGYIKAMVGGRSFEESEFNRAVQTKRQPGSAFKPFIYVAALDNGYVPCDTITDEPISFVGAGGRPWVPHNYDRTFRGEMTLRYALQLSINIPAIKLLRSVGPSTVADYARRMGLRARIPNELTVALGTSEVSLLDLTSAMGVLADEGIRAEPLMILRVEDREGRVLERNVTRTQEVLSAQTSYLATNMLQSVVDHGTGFGARVMGFYAPAAGKTGTTDDFTDAWFVGYTPQLVLGVWVGFDKKKTLGSGMTGTVAALPVWTEIMLQAGSLYNFTDFSVPEGVIQVEICKESHLLALEGCPEKTVEVFREGEEPKEFCYKHAGRDSGREPRGDPGTRKTWY